MTPFRVGLIGAGWISRTHLAALARVPEGRAVAVWSRSRERARRLAAEFGLEIATDRVDELIAAGVGLAYAEELPFVPKFARLRELLESGALGEPRYAAQREAHAGPYSPWFFTREEAGGGVLMDMACHGVECLRWLLGKPPVDRVTAHLGRSAHAARGELEDHAVLHLEFATGATGLVEASWALEGGMQSRLEVWGARGFAEADLTQATGLRVYAREAGSGGASGWSTPPADWLWENGYPQELSHFLRCFASGETPSESAADGLAVLEVLYAAYVSARERRSVALPCRPRGVARAVDLWLSA